MFRFSIIILMASFLAACYSGSESSSNGKGLTGTGGSTARYTIQNGFLIAVEEDLISAFGLDNPLQPEKLSVLYGNRGRLETVFPFGKQLVFIGSQTGSAILRVHDGSDIEQSGYGKGEMEIVSQISHATACDPVVANDTHMYVTIRSGVDCVARNSSNRLLIYDITDLERPIEVSRKQISQPFGLSLRANELFVCYANGLKHYDVSDPKSSVEVGDYKTASCNDVIALDDSLLLTGDEKISQARIVDGAFTLISEVQKGA